MKGRHYTADQQAPNLAILLSNKLGERMYSTIAPMMGLPLARQAQRLRAADCCSMTYMPGLNNCDRICINRPSTKNAIFE